MFIPFIFSSALLFSMDRAPKESPTLITSELIKNSQVADWRTIKQENLLYLSLTSGKVLIELNPTFAPNHFKNIQNLAQQKYWDKQRFVRSQDNYVVQWGGGSKSIKKLTDVREKIPGEYEITSLDGQHFQPLNDKDVYAEEVGFVDSFPVGTDSKSHWLLHCYGALGVGRDMAFDSGNGSELYVVIGHSPRHLDRNITLVGTVRQGMEHLSTLKRGKETMGFYKNKKMGAQIKSIRMGDQLPKKQQVQLEILKSNTEVFRNLILARKNRQESWFHKKAGHVSVCNVPLPIRIKTF